MSILVAMEARKGRDEPHALAVDSIGTADSGRMVNDSVKGWYHGDIPVGCVGGIISKQRFRHFLDDSEGDPGHPAHLSRLRDVLGAFALFDAFEEHCRRMPFLRSEDTGRYDPAWGNWTGVVLVPRGGIVLASSSGAMHEPGHLTVGVGSEFALGYLQAYLDGMWDEPDTTEIVKGAAAAVCRHYSEVVEPVQVFTIMPEEAAQ